MPHVLDDRDRVIDLANADVAEGRVGLLRRQALERQHRVELDRVRRHPCLAVVEVEERHARDRCAGAEPDSVPRGLHLRPPRRCRSHGAAERRRLGDHRLAVVTEHDVVVVVVLVADQRDVGGHGEDVPLERQAGNRQVRRGRTRGQEGDRGRLRGQRRRIAGSRLETLDLASVEAKALRESGPPEQGEDGRAADEEGSGGEEEACHLSSRVSGRDARRELPVEVG